MKWSHKWVKWSSQMSINKSSIWRKMMACLIYTFTASENAVGDFQLFSIGFAKQCLKEEQLLYSLKSPEGWSCL